MSERNLKSTRQRDLIVQIFFDTTEHISVEELYERAKEKDSNIGFATVYRTMKMLTDSGLANRRDFGDGHARYENTYEGEHHDHMICNHCGEITEFESEVIIAMKDEIAQRKGFRSLYHKLELYGICRKCQKETDR
jgi:Fur family ferric uptake transcriptional regulator